MHAHARKGETCAQLFNSIMMHVFCSCMHMRVRIIMNVNMMVDTYIDSLSFKFYEDPFIGCGEIDETTPSMHIHHF